MTSSAEPWLALALARRKANGWIVHWRLIEGSVKVNGFPVRQCEALDGVRVVSSVSSRQAAASGGSFGLMLPDMGARWWLRVVWLAPLLVDTCMGNNNLG